jgi:hypothetical protein
MLFTCIDKLLLLHITTFVRARRIGIMLRQNDVLFPYHLFKGYVGSISTLFH